MLVSPYSDVNSSRLEYYPCFNPEMYMYYGSGISTIIVIG